MDAFSFSMGFFDYTGSGGHAQLRFPSCSRIPVARGLFIHVVTTVETHIGTAFRWGFDICDVMKRGDVIAKQARIPVARGLFIHFVTCVDTHIRTTCPWGVDISDATIRGSCD